mmetsp:Transcript_11131/g.21876  ORF Transcript_11131/g.21876 Transcript_11131/m.21876 type:complete len:584 (+) Transcript_11131:471-2222(+)
MDCPFMSPNDSFSHLSMRGSEPAKQSDISELAEPDERGRQILIMNVDIGDGRTDEIVVHECDEPDDLAKAFCSKYDLSPQICQALSLQIESNIEQLVEEQCTYVDESPKKPKHSFESPQKGHLGTSYYRKAYDELRSKQPKFGGSFTERVRASPKKTRLESKVDHYTNLPGHRLYEKGMMMKRAQQEVARKRLKEKLEQETAGLSFSPKILKRVATEAMLSEFKVTSITDRLKNKEQKLKKMREEMDYQELIACTFKPEISDGSRDMMKNRGVTASERLDQLYKEAKELDEKRKFAELNSIRTFCTFKPEIHESPVKNSCSANTTPVRLRKQASPLKSSETVEPECSFKPKTGRPPKFKRNSESLPIGQYLYAQKPQKEQVSAAVEKQMQSFKQQSQAQFAISENSSKIVDKLRFDRYEQIFKAFCKDGANEAEWDLSIAETLEAKLIRVITPFIEELAKSTEKTDLAKFCEALDQHAKKMSPIEKSILYSTGKAAPVPEKLPFKPKITEYTSSSLKNRNQVKLYERLLKDQQRTRSKLNEKKIKKIEDEMYECTFYPNTIELRNSLRQKPVDADDKEETREG